MTIEQKAEQMLQGNEVLIEVLKSRNAYGLKKYGKSLDDNDIPERDRAIHAIQELLDAGQYMYWLGKTEEVLFIIADELQRMFELTAQEIIDGGKK